MPKSQIDEQLDKLSERVPKNERWTYRCYRPLLKEFSRRAFLQGDVKHEERIARFINKLLYIFVHEGTFLNGDNFTKGVLMQKPEAGTANFKDVFISRQMHIVFSTFCVDNGLLKKTCNARWIVEYIMQQYIDGETEWIVESYNKYTKNERRFK